MRGAPSITVGAIITIYPLPASTASPSMVAPSVMKLLPLRIRGRVCGRCARVRVDAIRFASSASSDAESGHSHRHHCLRGSRIQPLEGDDAISSSGSLSGTVARSTLESDMISMLCAQPTKFEEESACEVLTHLPDERPS